MLNRSNPYYKQVELLVALMPLVGQEKCFALKGGSAINLFVRNLPRLSVDLDLTFLPVKDRAQSLAEMEETRRRIVNLIRDQLNDAQRNFLISFKAGRPDWSLLPQPDVANLPAVKWKLINIRQMTEAKHKKAMEKLERVLYG